MYLGTLQSMKITLRLLSFPEPKAKGPTPYGYSYFVLWKESCIRLSVASTDRMRMRITGRGQGTGKRIQKEKALSLQPLRQ